MGVSFAHLNESNTQVDVLVGKGQRAHDGDGRERHVAGEVERDGCAGGDHRVAGGGQPRGSPAGEGGVGTLRGSEGGEREQQQRRAPGHGGETKERRRLIGPSP